MLGQVFYYFRMFDVKGLCPRAFGAAYNFRARVNQGVTAFAEIFPFLYHKVLMVLYLVLLLGQAEKGREKEKNKYDAHMAKNSNNAKNR